MKRQTASKQIEAIDLKPRPAGERSGRRLAGEGTTVPFDDVNLKAA